MKKLADDFVLNNGVKIPSIGYGTWKTPDGETAVAAVKAAIEEGYRHIDTAAFYKNEKSVGEAVRSCGLPREELFITSKLWNLDRGYENTKRAFNKTLEELGVEYLDLYLIHWPAIEKQFADWKDINASTWKAMEELYKEGKIKAIGVSNFQRHHLEALLEMCEIPPMVNQIEFHPGFMQQQTVQYCKEHSIIVEAWSPLGNGTMLENESLVEIAKKYEKSVAQICIRWTLQHGILPLPKSITPSRIHANIDVFDFVLTKEDCERIDQMTDCGGMCVNSDEIEF